MNKWYKIFIFLFLMVALNGCKTQHFQVYDKYNIDKNMEGEKFDIESFEKQGIGIRTFVKNNAKITQDKSASGYTEYIHPIGKFYDILKDYYLNGNIRESGMRLSNVKLGVWKYYDENGNLTNTIDEEAKFKDVPFDYNKVMRWLDKKGYVELETAKGKDNITLSFNPKTKIWGVTVVDRISLYREYYIDRNGKILKEEDVRVVY